MFGEWIEEVDREVNEVENYCEVIEVGNYYEAIEVGNYEVIGVGNYYEAIGDLRQRRVVMLFGGMYGHEMGVDRYFDYQMKEPVGTCWD